MRFAGVPKRAALALFLIAITGCAGNDLPADAAPDDLLAHARQKLDEGKHFDAAESLQFFLRNHPGTAATPVAKMMLGDARFGMEEYILAEGDYQQIVSDFPASPLVEEARYKIARCSYASILPFYLDQTETERAVRQLEEFRRDYPGSRFLPEVEEAIAACREQLAHGEYRSGMFYRSRQRYKPASIQFKFVVQRYPETPWAARSALSLGEMYSARQRWEDAADWYQRVVRDWPETDEAQLAKNALGAIPNGQALSQLPEAEE